jgi:septal ring factor EnvC (AmiA/AmiB activator)
MDNLSSTGLVGIAAAVGTVLGAFVKIVLDWRSGSTSVAGQTNQIAFNLINELRAEVDRAKTQSADMQRLAEGQRQQIDELIRQLQDARRELSQQSHRIDDLERELAAAREDNASQKRAIERLLRNGK